MYEKITQLLLEAHRLVENAQTIVVLSGAGISEASGIPTYRDAAGLWQNPENLKFSDIQSYRDDPEAFVSFWKEPVRHVLAAKPNSAHFALRSLQRWKPKTLLVTQNVDGLLQEAGCTDVIELHGSLRRLRCDSCGLNSNFRLERCLRCGSEMRPDVVLFGEMLDEILLSKAQSAAAVADLIVVAGTTAEVYPAASIPFIGLQNGSKMIVVDNKTTSISKFANVVLRGQAEIVLPKFLVQ
jgi:NAD-dependent deacetylase